MLHVHDNLARGPLLMFITQWLRWRVTPSAHVIIITEARKNHHNKANLGSEKFCLELRDDASHALWAKASHIAKSEFKGHWCVILPQRGNWLFVNKNSSLPHLENIHSNCCFLWFLSFLNLCVHLMNIYWHSLCIGNVISWGNTEIKNENYIRGEKQIHKQI